jgi:hypothetical protein
LFLKKRNYTKCTVANRRQSTSKTVKTITNIHGVPRGNNCKRKDRNNRPSYRPIANKWNVYAADAIAIKKPPAKH